MHMLWLAVFFSDHDLSDLYISMCHIYFHFAILIPWKDCFLFIWNLSKCWPVTSTVDIIPLLELNIKYSWQNTWRGGHYWDYWAGIHPFSHFTAVHIEIERPKIPTACNRSSNEVKWVGRGERKPGGRLNKKDGLTRYGNSHVKDKTS